MHPDLVNLLKSPPVRLSYSVHSASGYVPSFPPEKILIDCPTDDNSRWTTPTPDARKKERQQQQQTSTSNNHMNSFYASSSSIPLKKGESEWILIEFASICLVNKVGFGKTIKAHPCNLSEFTIYGGLTSNSNTLELLLENGSLKNDSITQEFELPIEIDQREGKDSTVFPVKFLKIDCHEAVNVTFSIAIWHLFFQGYVLSTSLSSIALNSLQHYQQTLNSHLILSHLRRTEPPPPRRRNKGGGGVSSSSSSSSSSCSCSTFQTYLKNLPLTISSNFEHSLLSKLHETLVVKSDFESSETILKECLENDLFREWRGGGGGRGQSSSSSRLNSTLKNVRTTRSSRRKGITIAKWERLDNLHSLPRSGGRGGIEHEQQPGPRGGHQMVKIGRKLLLFGGWDGKKDLGDLWEWELPRSKGGDQDVDNDYEEERGGWRCIYTGEEEEEEGVEMEERPSKRSCHQFAVDESSGWVYLLGARRDDELPKDNDDAMEIEHGQGQGQDRWKSDFWRYKAVGTRGKWECLSRDTRQDGGPALLFDHAMVVDSINQRLFVFGGKWQPYEGGVGETIGEDQLPATSAPTSQYSGMYCYDITTRKWTHLFGDGAATPASFMNDRLVPRAGHSMVIDSTSHKNNSTIYVFGGQRDTRYENDLWAIKLATPRDDDDERTPLDGDDDDDEGEEEEEDESGQLWRQGVVIDATPESQTRRAIVRSLIDASLLPVSPESSPSRISSSSRRHHPTIVQIRRLDYKNDFPLPPPAAFTPRLSITSDACLTLLTGLTRVGNGSSMREIPLEGIWRKNLSARGGASSWERIEEWSSNVTTTNGSEERRPKNRFASQVVYDPLRNEHYIFGGHPHDLDNPEERLSDFWKLKIIDPTPEEALRKTRFLVRKQKFNELCHTVPTIFALQYLQNDLSLLVDHTSPSESQQFRSCMTALLSAPPKHNVEVSSSSSLDSSLVLGASATSSPQEAAKDSNHHDDQVADDEFFYRQRHELFEELMEFFPRSERQPVEKFDHVAKLLRRSHSSSSASAAAFTRVV